MASRAGANGRPGPVIEERIASTPLPFRYGTTETYVRPEVSAPDHSTGSKAGALPQTPPKAMPLETIYIINGVQGRRPWRGTGRSPVLPS